MVVFPWDRSLATGVESVDKEHRQLTSLINDFLEAVLEAKGAEKAADLLTGLKAYTDEHFRNEERLIAESEFSEMERHVEEHRWFRKQVSALEEMLATEDPEFPSRALKLLKVWFTNHVKQTDMKYVPALKKKGLA